MNNQNPLIPQGSLLAQKNKGRARVRLAVFVVLAIHGIGLLALLMQGCKKEPEPPIAPVEHSETNTLPALTEPTNALPVDATNVTTSPTSPPPVVDTPPQVTLPAVAATTTYKVAKGTLFKVYLPIKEGMS